MLVPRRHGTNYPVFLSFRGSGLGICKRRGKRSRMAAPPSDGRVYPGKRLYEKMAGLDGKERMEFFKTTVQQSLLSFKKSSFALKEGDVFIVTAPKCGTTWTQCITKLIRNHGQEDGVDVDGAFPWIDVMSRDEADVRSA